MKIKLQLTLNGAPIKARASGRVVSSLVSRGASGTCWVDGAVIAVHSALGESVDAWIAEYIGYCLNEGGELEGAVSDELDSGEIWECRYAVTLNKAERARLRGLLREEHR